jgi:hypothetical protein
MGRAFYNALIGELARKQIFLKEDALFLEADRRESKTVQGPNNHPRVLQITHYIKQPT